MEEIWKDIEGYEGCYQVSNLGRVKSLNYKHTGKEEILKVRTKKNGYLQINLCKEGNIKTYTIHRLVATTFIENSDNLPVVNHIDEDKTNNRVENLEWCSIEYNNKYGTHIQRCADSNKNNPRKTKKVLCVETGVIYPSLRQVEKELGFSHTRISRACKGMAKLSHGFNWRYIN